MIKPSAPPPRAALRAVVIGVLVTVLGTLTLAMGRGAVNHVAATTKMRSDFDRYVVLDSVWRTTRLRNDSIQNALNLDILCSPMIRPTDRRC